MISSLRKARKWIGGFQLVVLLSIIGLKIFPTTLSACKHNFHFLTLLRIHQCYYQGKQISAAPEGTLSCASSSAAILFLDERSHPLGFTTKTCPGLLSWPLTDHLSNGSFCSTFSSHLPSQGCSGVCVCVRVVSPCIDTYQNLGVRVEFKNKVAFCPLL